MYYYFSSEYPVAMKLNGIYYGILNETVKHLRIDNGSPFVELCPLCEQETSVNFILDDNFLKCPPASITVTDMKGGYLIKLYPSLSKSSFQIINQKKFNDAVVTVFTENGLKLSIETPKDFYAETIKLNCNRAEIEKFRLGDKTLIYISFICTKQLLYVFCIDEKITKVFCRTVDDFSIDNGLTTTEKYCDIAKHNCVTEWGFDGKTLTSKHVSVTENPDFNVDNLHEKLIPYAFLECFLVNTNVDDYLVKNIIEQKNHLKDYLGDYVGILPPPRFRNINEVGLIYRVKENFYRIDYFTFELDGRKICNVKKCDD